MTVVSVFGVRPHRVFRELMRILKAQAGREGAYIASITVPTPQIFFFFLQSILWDYCSLEHILGNASAQEKLTQHCLQSLPQMSSGLVSSENTCSCSESLLNLFPCCSLCQKNPEPSFLCETFLEAARHWDKSHPPGSHSSLSPRNLITHMSVFPTRWPASGKASPALLVLFNPL